MIWNLICPHEPARIHNATYIAEKVEWSGVEWSNVTILQPREMRLGYLNEARGADILSCTIRRRREPRDNKASFRSPAWAKSVDPKTARWPKLKKIQTWRSNPPKDRPAGCQSLSGLICSVEICWKFETFERRNCEKMKRKTTWEYFRDSGILDSAFQLVWRQHFSVETLRGSFDH